MSDIFDKVKDADAIKQLDIMEGKTSSGKGHFDTKEGGVRHVYVTKDVPTSETSTFVKRRMETAGLDTSTFVKRRMKMAGLDTLKKVPGPIGKAVAAGALAGVALEKGINKLKSMKEKDAESEPTASDVEGKAKGGSIMARGNKIARMKPTKMY
jgi:hypothetical protein